ncbi:hypothetical protein Pyn_35812 [Prunus yedoensis var. nudiflora]|uniref:Uncharacterized protein n=1 Tax=Prunus yedoensis var. nudiflora TaxID=2094558 RepID=A0A314UVW3_PRUYE|nr:hypothetical protein Pyn_35812 [Prunus yedoensis var. nudiflora]
MIQNPWCTLIRYDVQNSKYTKSLFFATTAFWRCRLSVFSRTYLSGAVPSFFFSVRTNLCRFCKKHKKYGFDKLHTDFVAGVSAVNHQGTGIKSFTKGDPQGGQALVSIWASWIYGYVTSNY